MHTFTAISVLLFASVASAFPLTAKRATVCDGRTVETWNRSYGNMTFIEGHNNYTVNTNVLDLPRDQEVDANSQFNLGARLLQV